MPANQATPLPTPYAPLASYGDWEANHPGEPVPGTELDAEFSAVALAVSATQSRLAQLQNDDGSLGNQTVGKDQMDPALFDIFSGGFYPKGAWQATTTYAVGDAVNSDGILWATVVAHMSSGNFAADVSAGRWMFISQPVAASSIPITPIATIPSVNVQGALDVLAAKVADLTARVVALESAP